MNEFTEANRKYFDQMAASYQERFASSMKILADQTLKHRLWISDRWIDTLTGQDQDVQMLEYACGPGVVSMTLAPFLTKVVGMDLADKMVDEFNHNAQSAGLADHVVGFKADLLADNVPAKFMEAEFMNFDVVTISMALHHFEQPDNALQRLAGRLKQGGSCFIIDVVPHAHHDHTHRHGHEHEKHDADFGEAAHTVKTHGFSRDDMQTLFAGAGLDVGFDYEVLPEPLVFFHNDQKLSKTVFIARAQRG